MKLAEYGFELKTLQWIENYLSNRQQFVSFNVLSNVKTLKWGLPQGSCLGPLLFAVFTNDLPNVLFQKESSTVSNGWSKIG